MRIVLHREALRELSEAYEWYRVRDASAGEAFRNAFDRAVSLLDRYPESGSPWREGTRRVLFDAFPYYLVYRTTPEVVLVLAVMHSRRRPDAWHGR